LFYYLSMHLADRVQCIFAQYSAVHTLYCNKMSVTIQITSKWLKIIVGILLLSGTLSL